MSEKVKKPFYKKWWVWVGVIVVLGVLAQMGGKKNSSNSGSALSSAAADVATGKIVEFVTGALHGPLYVYFDDGTAYTVHYKLDKVYGGGHSLYKRESVEQCKYDCVGSATGYTIELHGKSGPSSVQVDTAGQKNTFSIRWGNASNPNQMLTAVEVRNVGEGKDAYDITSSEQQVTQ